MDTETQKLKGIKESELRAIGKCGVCHKLLGDTVGLPVFYVIEIRRAMLDIRALQRQTGLEIMMGSPTLAAILGLDEDMAKFLCEPKKLFVHDRCADKIQHLAMLLED
jgi:hypothetical protein